MLLNYFKIAFRNLKKNPQYSFINIVGLSVGLACFILIALFIRFEFSYDSFHEKSDRIYRIAKTDLDNRFLGIKESANTAGPLDDVLMQDFPEVEFATQLTKANSFFEFDNKLIQENGVFVSTHFFDVFTFPLIQGNPKNLLSDPYSIVLTETLAKKYFGNENPVGNSLMVSLAGEHFSGQNPMLVTGVIKDVPANSHLTFDYIVSVKSSQELVNYLDSWRSNSYLTYVSLKENQPIANFEQNLIGLQEKYIESDQRGQNSSTLFPKPLKSIHLTSSMFGEFQTNGSMKYVYFFGAIACIILLIACINYTNLATARSTIRAKEVGVRKAIGARKNQLVIQFLSESVILSILSLLVAFAIVQILLPTFNELAARSMVLDINNNRGFFFVLISIGVIVGILSGSYPAFKISSFQPIQVLKGISGPKSRKSSLRNGLVITQFAATITLIIGTLTIYKQLQYVQNSDTGIDREQIVSVNIKDQKLYERYSTLKSILENNTNVINVSASQNDPIDINSSSTLTDWEGAENEESISIYRSAIQHDYIDLFNLEIVEGRDFSSEISTDEREGMLINETLKSQLGWENAVGKEFNFRGREALIIGVVQDFNFLSFHEEIAPLALFLETNWWFPYQHLFIKIDAANVKETLAFIETTMNEFSPDYPFEYHFMDDAYNNLYQTEIRLGSVFNYFTLLALIIASLGILGLAAFTASQREKEIGIRKVLGATVGNVVTLLTKDFIKPVLIGFAIASPIAWYVMNTWLTEFAYRIEIGISTFLIAGLATIAVALFTVSWQSIKAALANPVDSLKSE